jgi:hypothetical protein
MSKYISLAGRLRESLVDLEKSVNRAVKLGKQAAKSGDDGYWDGVAFNLDSFYSGVERIFGDIALTVDGSIPEGTEWHRDLLYQVSAEVGGRPSVIARDTRRCLEELREFRLMVREKFAFNIRPSQLEALARDLPECAELNPGRLPDKHLLCRSNPNPCPQVI